MADRYIPSRIYGQWKQEFVEYEATPVVVITSEAEYDCPAEDVFQLNGCALINRYSINTNRLSGTRKIYLMSSSFV